jgi:hypothetical protein
MTTSATNTGITFPNASTQTTSKNTFGYNQTLQNLTGSRLLKQTYYNTESVSIFVSITIEFYSTTLIIPTITITVNGLLSSNIGNSGSDRGADMWLCASCVIPPGGSYVVNYTVVGSPPTVTINNWEEFR